MGYVHYFQRPRQLDHATFAAWSRDCAAIVRLSREMGISLAGPNGTGEPEISPTRVGFNGASLCGHPEEDLGIAWPAAELTSALRPIESDESAVVETWPGGACLSSRTCGGRCSHESFEIAREHEPYGAWDRPNRGMYSDFTKTAFKPYDLTVTACLLMLAYRFGDTVCVTSDGYAAHWQDGRQLALLACGIFPPIPLSIRPAPQAALEPIEQTAAEAAASFMAASLPPPTDRMTSRTNHCRMQDATRRALFGELGKRGYRQRETRLAFASNTLGYAVDSFTVLSEREARDVLYTLMAI